MRNIILRSKALKNRSKNLVIRQFDTVLEAERYLGERVTLRFINYGLVRRARDKWWALCKRRKRKNLIKNYDESKL